MLTPLMEGERLVSFKIKFDSELNDSEYYVVYGASLGAFEGIESFEDALESPKLSLGKCFMVLGERYKYYTNDTIAYYVFPQKEYPTNTAKHYYLEQTSLGRLPEDANYIPEDENKSRYLVSERPAGVFNREIDKSESKTDVKPRIFNYDECVFFKVLKRSKTDSDFEEFSNIFYFRMPDTYNIAICGESFAAGEGAPDVEKECGGSDAQWVSRVAHRSNNSGFILGVKKFILHYPEVAVSYVHAANSGAKVREFYEFRQEVKRGGIVGFVAGDTVATMVDLQFNTVKNFLENQNHDNIHHFLMSIGGNDAGFEDVVVMHLLFPLPLSPNFDRNVNRSLRDLRTSYNKLHRELTINQTFFKKPYSISISNYPDPTSGPYGRCGFQLLDPNTWVRPMNFPEYLVNPDEFAIEELFGYLTMKFGCQEDIAALSETLRILSDFASLNVIGVITTLLGKYQCCEWENQSIINNQDEYEQIYREFLVPLNERIKNVAKNNEWNLIEVDSKVGIHGICNCESPYFNNIASSFAVQGDLFGLVHPNKLGYKEIYEDAVLKDIQTSFEKYSRDEDLRRIVRLSRQERNRNLQRFGEIDCLGKISGPINFETEFQRILRSFQLRFPENLRISSGQINYEKFFTQLASEVKKLDLKNEKSHMKFEQIVLRNLEQLTGQNNVRNLIK